MPRNNAKARAAMHALMQTCIDAAFQRDTADYRLVDSEFLEFVAQCADRDSELLCRGSLVIAGFLERFHDRFPLEVADIAVQAAFAGIARLVAFVGFSRR